MAAELRRINSVFHCDVCSKQYTRIGEYENHMSSYDHHHRKRLRDLREREARRELSDSRKTDIRQQQRELKSLHAVAAAAIAAAAKESSDGAASVDGAASSPHTAAAGDVGQSTVPAPAPRAAVAFTLRPAGRPTGVAPALRPVTLAAVLGDADADDDADADAGAAASAGSSGRSMRGIASILAKHPP